MKHTFAARAALAFVAVVFPLLAQQPNQNQPVFPLEAITNQGAYDSTVGNAVNYNFWELEVNPNANAGKIQSVLVCNTPAPSDTYVLTFSASNNCWYAAAGSGGGGSGNFASITVSGTANFGTASTAPTSWQLCDTNCTHPSVFSSLSTGPGVFFSNSIQIDKTTNTVSGTGGIGTTCTAGQLGTHWVVTDASSPSIGSTVVGGAAANAEVWCNGSAITVTGI